MLKTAPVLLRNEVKYAVSRQESGRAANRIEVFDTWPILDASRAIVIFLSQRMMRSVSGCCM
jgi:hypothetical protein